MFKTISFVISLIFMILNAAIASNPTFFYVNASSFFEYPSQQVINQYLVEICGPNSSPYIDCHFTHSFQPPSEVLPNFNETNVGGVRWGRVPSFGTYKSGLLFAGLQNIEITESTNFFPIGILVHENWVIYLDTALPSANSDTVITFGSSISDNVDIPFLIDETPNYPPCQYCETGYVCDEQTPCPDKISINLPNNVLKVPFADETIYFELKFFKTFNNATGNGTDFIITQEQKFNPVYLFARVLDRVGAPQALNDTYTVLCINQNNTLDVLANDTLGYGSRSWNYSTLAVYKLSPIYGTVTVNFTGDYATFTYVPITAYCTVAPRVDHFSYQICTNDSQCTSANVTVNILEPAGPPIPQICVQVQTGDITSCLATFDIYKQLQTTNYDVNCTVDFIVPAGTDVAFTLTNSNPGNLSNAMTFNGTACCNTPERLVVDHVNSTYALFSLSAQYGVTSIAPQLAVLMESICIRCFAAICANCDALLG